MQRARTHTGIRHHTFLLLLILLWYIQSRILQVFFLKPLIGEHHKVSQQPSFNFSFSVNGLSENAIKLKNWAMIIAKSQELHENIMRVKLKQFELNGGNSCTHWPWMLLVSRSSAWIRRPWLFLIELWTLSLRSLTPACSINFSEQVSMWLKKDCLLWSSFVLNKVVKPITIQLALNFR